MYAVHLQGKANIEMTTSRYHTPLLVAVNAGQCHVIELLVNKGNRQQSYILLCIVFHLQETRADFIARL